MTGPVRLGPSFRGALVAMDDLQLCNAVPNGPSLWRVMLCRVRPPGPHAPAWCALLCGTQTMVKGVFTGHMDGPRAWCPPRVEEPRVHDQRGRTIH
ncbi:hypothetical protein GCM10010358_62970 [Streptomyces minutiscleroticus]|uniref:Uncharacterized protein n=1 Tax=Streptomyces minutiscleroticus TaxID=68238 RepID=A0A918NWS0_9ACTN|nr:hypothetical protein GCM10010358_62970 [Streptomyces minutiscleroticus]